jgi:hypothetical protein
MGTNEKAISGWVLYFCFKKTYSQFFVKHKTTSPNTPNWICRNRNHIGQT